MRFLSLPPVKEISLFVVVFVLYTAWATGLSFEFEEVDHVFPTYDMLATAFAHQRLDIDAPGKVDVTVSNGKTYFYGGPVPAVLRTPVVRWLGIGVPTGLAVCAFCAGIAVLFALILRQMTPPPDHHVRATRIALTVLMAVNGFSLSMVLIPTFHNEAISAAMFFLLMAVFLLLRARSRRYAVSFAETALLAVALAFSYGSRFSYVFAAGLISMAFVVQTIRHRPAGRAIAVWGATGMMLLMNAAALIVLLAYNEARFGDPLDFGLRSLESYKSYFQQTGYFRYDHIPHNLWSFFFRLPDFVPRFPFVILPGFILTSESIGLMAYKLMNVNELSASVLLLLPITGFAFLPLFDHRIGKGSPLTGIYFLIASMFFFQVVTIAATIAAVLRYYFDFLPLLMIMAYVGIVRLQRQNILSIPSVLALTAISLIMSFPIPLNAAAFYKTYIRYTAPLLDLFPL